jgi:Fic family protein
MAIFEEMAQESSSNRGTKRRKAMSEEESRDSDGAFFILSNSDINITFEDDIRRQNQKLLRQEHLENTEEDKDGNSENGEEGEKSEEGEGEEGEGGEGEEGEENSEIGLDDKEQALATQLSGLPSHNMV